MWMQYFGLTRVILFVRLSTCVCMRHPGLESKRELMSEFVEGEFDPNDQKMYKLLGLDALDEKKTRVNSDDFKLPGVRGRVLT